MAIYIHIQTVYICNISTSNHMSVAPQWQVGSFMPLMRIHSTRPEQPHWPWLYEDKEIMWPVSAVGGWGRTMWKKSTVNSYTVIHDFPQLETFHFKWPACRFWFLGWCKHLLICFHDNDNEGNLPWDFLNCRLPAMYFVHPLEIGLINCTLFSPLFLQITWYRKGHGMPWIKVLDSWDALNIGL